MNRHTHYVLYFVLIWIKITLVSGVRKDVCDKCVKIEDCPMFANMPKHEQQIWLEQVPCDGGQNNGVSSVFGFSPVAKGDYICCPNSNVWGIDQGGSDHQNNRPQEPPKIRPNDNNGPGSFQHPGNQNINQQGNYGYQQRPTDQNVFGQPHQQRPTDQNVFGQPHIQPGNNLGNPKPRPTNPNIFGGQQNGLNNPNPYDRPSNNPINPSIYDHPQSRPDGPDIFGHYPNGNNNNGVFGSQPGSINSGPQIRPNEPNIYGHNPNGPANHGVYGNQPNQYPGNGMNVLGNPGQNYPNNRYPNTQNPIQQGVMTPGHMQNQNQFTQRPNNYLGQQQPNSYLNNGIGNAFGRQNEAQQCPVQTSLPPDPSTGCCGQDMSDSDRITDLQSILNMYAPSNQHRPQNNWPQQNNYPQQQNYQPNRPYYPQGLNRRKRSTENTTSVPDTDVVLDDRIAGGKETELDQFPWTVLLKVTFDYGDKQASFSCGGSLISPRYVLTAGHCIYEKDAKVTDIELTLAEYDKSTFPRDCKMVPGEGKQCVDNVVMHAEDVIRHPQYDDDRLHNDIALVRLHGYAPYTRFIRSVCLPPIDIDNPDFSNLPLAVAGWGRNGPYVTDIKQSTVVHLVPHDECEKSYPHLTRSHLCAAGRTGEDTCKGDSGGPLMMLYRGSYYVIGVVSGKRADSPCGSTVPSLYTNVFQYVQWIRNNIKN